MQRTEKDCRLSRRFRAEPEFTAGQENAIATAKSYLDVGGFSKTNLIDQLEFGGFTTQQAFYGVNTTAL
jgi:Host cell surface-exposed lipoprotein